jgi:hypothetical protein
MNPMQMKTPAERKLIAIKSHATRRANKEAEKRMRAETHAQAIGLKDEIAELERQRDALQMQQIASLEAVKLTGKTLLSESAVVKGAMPYSKVCGIYFLVRDKKIIYVGQSIDVFSRISTHRNDKEFDSIAYVPCEPSLLDKMESLYIHVLSPHLNGNMCNGAKLAPIALDKLLSA